MLDERILTPAEVEQYWLDNRERWRELWRFAQVDAKPRTGGVEDATIASRPIMNLRSMREGNERLQRKRRRK